MLDFLHAQYPAVQITLHAGELTEGLVPPEALRFHIRESVRTGHASRIGHGAGVMYQDDPLALLREMASKRVLVEIALSSNDLILGVKGSRHPLRTYLKYGVPVALVTDDAGVVAIDADAGVPEGGRRAGRRLSHAEADGTQLDRALLCGRADESAASGGFGRGVSGVRGPALATSIMVICARF